MLSQTPWHVPGVPMAIGQACQPCHSVVIVYQVGIPYAYKLLREVLWSSECIISSFEMKKNNIYEVLSKIFNGFL